MKFWYWSSHSLTPLSLPTLGAWIEISICDKRLDIYWSLPTLGAWIEIYNHLCEYWIHLSRSLHWERGLKSLLSGCRPYFLWSLPTLGAWIEIAMTAAVISSSVSSLPTLGAWIEITNRSYHWRKQKGRSLHWERGLKSLSSLMCSCFLLVAPYIGSVD